jgi:hypothetical protein
VHSVMLSVRQVEHYRTKCDPFFPNVSHRNLAAIARCPRNHYPLSLLALGFVALLPEYHSFSLLVVWVTRSIHINTVQYQYASAVTFDA